MEKEVFFSFIVCFFTEDCHKERLMIFSIYLVFTYFPSPRLQTAAAHFGAAFAGPGTTTPDFVVDAAAGPDLESVSCFAPNRLTPNRRPHAAPA
jgi:hypothetical protein